MNRNGIELVVTDLDGTLLDVDQKISARDLQTLHTLGERGICRVIATGRSFYSLNRVLPDNFPIDYLVFSSGVGVMEWKSKRVIQEHHLEAEEVRQAADLLLQKNLDFMIHDPVPENHHFRYIHSGSNNADFLHRIELYSEFSHELSSCCKDFGTASQLLCISQSGGAPLYHEIMDSGLNMNVIRTTSPLNHRSLWVELFPLHASKSLGVQEVCRTIECNPKHVLAVGNDYNDLDLLNWATHSFVVDNAPQDLKKRFETVASHCANGFSDAAGRCFRL